MSQEESEGGQEMKQEVKQLLIKDLCSRLPYGVLCKLSVKGADVSITAKLEFGGLEHFMFGTMDVKPYLRPMSSMTEEEKCEYCDLQDKFLCSSQYPVTDAYELFDWLNERHFDFRNLIGKGLAIDCTNLNIY